MGGGLAYVLRPVRIRGLEKLTMSCASACRASLETWSTCAQLLWQSHPALDHRATLAQWLPLAGSLAIIMLLSSVLCEIREMHILFLFVRISVTVSPHYS